MTDRVSERIWRAAQAAYESRIKAIGAQIGEPNFMVPWENLGEARPAIEYDAMVAAFGAVPPLAELEARIAELEAASVPVCIGRNLIGILAKEGVWKSSTGQCVVAADELHGSDPYERVRHLEERIDAAVVELQQVRAERDGLAQGLAYQESLVPKEEVARLQQEAIDQADLRKAVATDYERVRAALKPFAEYAEWLEKEQPGWLNGRIRYVGEMQTAWFIAALKAYRGEAVAEAEPAPDINICWHGTDEETAQIILREGFKPHTHFAAHIEDALAFGGPFVFDVVFDKPAPHWQFRPEEAIPPSRIRCLTQFWSKTLHGETSFRRTEGAP
jgi:hypothetical protein